MHTEHFACIISICAFHTSCGFMLQSPTLKGSAGVPTGRFLPCRDHWIFRPSSNIALFHPVVWLVKYLLKNKPTNLKLLFCHLNREGLHFPCQFLLQMAHVANVKVIIIFIIHAGVIWWLTLTSWKPCKFGFSCTTEVNGASFNRKIKFLKRQTLNAQ